MEPACSPDQICILLKACTLTKLQDQIPMEVTGTESCVRYEVSGCVKHCGSSVTRFRPGDEVVGILPLGSIIDMKQVPTELQLDEYLAVLKPGSVSLAASAVCVGPLLSAYSICHVQARVTSGTTAVILATSTDPFITAKLHASIQLLAHADVKVIVLYSGDFDKTEFKEINNCIHCEIDISEDESFVTAALDETMGLGVNLVVDSGVRQFSNEFKEQDKHNRCAVSKRDVLAMLSVGGVWVTHTSNLQLDPSDSSILQLKAASISFVNDYIWQLSNSRQSVYLHILQESMQKLENGSLKSMRYDTVTPEEAFTAIQDTTKHRQVALW